MGAKAAENPGPPGPESYAIAPKPVAELPTLNEIERNHILAALHKTGGKIEGANGAAKILTFIQIRSVTGCRNSESGRLPPARRSSPVHPAPAPTKYGSSGSSLQSHDEKLRNSRISLVHWKQSPYWFGGYVLEELEAAERMPALRSCAGTTWNQDWHHDCT